MIENSTKNETNNTEKFKKRHISADLPVLADNSPAALMQTAMNRGMDLDKLEKMLELQCRWEERESKKAFTKAMANFKADPPTIYKDKINKQFGSMYSSIDAMVNPAIPYLSKYGLSHSWQYGEPAEKQVVVTCTITHELGHSESVTMSAPPDTSGGNSKNPIQQIKSTQTYLKIATFEAVTGLVSQEANLNDDGNAASGKITLLEQWDIKFDEVSKNAKSGDEISTWWKQNSSVIKKELSKANAAKIYTKVNAYNKKLKAIEREPGSDG